MNKVELSIELGLSVQTINRYQGMGMPFEKIGGRYDFDLLKVQDWIQNNIDSRAVTQPSQSETMTSKQASAKAFELLKRWLPYVDFDRMLKDAARGRFGK